MKFFFINILIFVFVFFSKVSHSENWICSYVYDGESKILSRYRVNNLFKSKFNDDVHSITGENERYIYLSSVGRDVDIVFVTLLDKKNKRFSMIGMDTYKTSSFINGNCEIEY